MCTFDSPIGRCERVGEMVLLDETQLECAREHRCPDGTACPLAGHFAEQSGIAATTVLPPLNDPPVR